MRDCKKSYCILLLAALAPFTAAFGEEKIGEFYVEPLTGVEFVVVPAGCFVMAKNLIKNRRKLEHEVCVKEFKIGKTEVTQEQYFRIMGVNPSEYKGENLPVEKVNWHDAQNFIIKFGSLTKTDIRLPSEAEWEYACLGGLMEARYCGSGEDMNELGWYSGNSRKTTHSVAQKRENGFGVYDMSGNVAEWVQDCYNEAFDGVPANGNAWESEGCKFRVMRGGSFYEDEPISQSNKRRGWNSTRGYRHMGFRVVLE